MESHWGEVRGKEIRALSSSTTPHHCNHSVPEVLITFTLPISEKLSLEESVALITKQGYQRLLLDGEILRLEEALPQLRKSKPASLTILQDRIKPVPAIRARFVEACEQAYHFGKGKLAIYRIDNSSTNPQSAIRNPQLYSNRLHCATCDIEYRRTIPCSFSVSTIRSALRLCVPRIWSHHHH